MPTKKEEISENSENMSEGTKTVPQVLARLHRDCQREVGVLFTLNCGLKRALA